MSKTTKFAITTLWILFSRSYDAYCTHQHTPDLSKEANPLVSVLGMDWTPLLLVIGFLTLYVIYTYYLVLFKPKDLLPQESGYTFGQLSLYLYTGKKAPWYKALLQFPDSMGRLNQYVGHVLTRCLVFVGFVSTIMWLLINHSAYYKTIHSAPAIYTIILVGIALITYQWNREQYRQYLARR